MGVIKGLDQNRLFYTEIWMLIPVLKFATKRDLKEASQCLMDPLQLLKPFSHLLIQKHTGKEQDGALVFPSHALCLSSDLSFPSLPPYSTSLECSLLPNPIHTSPSNAPAFPQVASSAQAFRKEPFFLHPQPTGALQSKTTTLHCKQQISDRSWSLYLQKQYKIYVLICG